MGLKKLMITLVLCPVLAAALGTAAFAQELLLGGQAVGIQISTRGVLVAGLTEISTADGESCPAGDAGICAGDLIVGVGGTELDSAQDFVNAVGELDGQPVTVTVERGGVTDSYTVQPVQSSEGQWMLGMWLRDGISGIGTLTFIDPDSGVYGALGHSISDSGTELLVPLRDGSITDAEIVSVVPGSSGNPGELNGCADAGKTLGSVERNTELGIYGHVFTQIGKVVVETGEMHTGAAAIISTVNGREAKEYDAEINRIYNEAGGQRMMLTVTDPELCSMTGGIVQGMSGSPVMQDGKLVGAVTHVFVSDPTKGFGIGIYDMLEAAGIKEQAA